MAGPNRDASRPVAGAARETIRLALAGVIVGLLAQVMPEEVMGDVRVLAFAATAIGAAAAGKWLRQKGWGVGEFFVVPLAVLPLLIGCASTGAQTTAERPILERTLFDEDGNKTGEVKVSLLAELVSRGCILLDISPEGAVSLFLQQDGSGDWSVVRGVVAILPETVAVVMNPVSTPIAAIVEALSGRPPMEPPSEIHGCTGLLYDYLEGVEE